MVATACTEHSYWLALAFEQTQALANWNARSKQWQPWLAGKRLRFLRFSFTQRKRLRLNGNHRLTQCTKVSHTALQHVMYVSTQDQTLCGTVCYGVAYLLYTQLSMVDRRTDKLVHLRWQLVLTDQIDASTVTCVRLLTDEQLGQTNHARLTTYIYTHAHCS